MIGQCHGPWGVLWDEPADAYHTSGAIGSSAINDFCKCEELFRGRYIERRWLREVSREMRIGTAVHCYRLEGPRPFRQRNVVKPRTYVSEKGEVKSWNGNANVCKTWELAQDGKEVWSADDDQLIRTIALALRQNDYVRAVLRSGKPEVSIRIDTERWKLPVQCRLDWWSPALGIFDLKATENVDTWKRDAYSMGYHRQAELYSWLTMTAMDMASRPPFTFIVVERQPPHRVRLYELSESFHELAWEEVDCALTRIAERLNNGGWVRDRDGIDRIDVPKWIAGVTV